MECNPSSGVVDPVTIERALRPNTALVSVMLANNETGIIQPVSDIAASVRRWNKEKPGQRQVMLHTDAAQVCEYDYTGSNWLVWLFKSNKLKNFID